MRQTDYYSLKWIFLPLVKKALTKLPKKSGVYMIARGSIFNFTPLYVGSTHNLKERASGHTKIKKVITKYSVKKLRFLYCEIEKRGEYRNIEGRIISFCRPILNTEYKTDYNKGNCDPNDYFELCLKMQSVIGRHKSKKWVAAKLGMPYGEYCKKSQTRWRSRCGYFTKSEIGKFNDVFGSDLCLQTIHEKLKLV